jgi:hypothetical protein
MKGSKIALLVGFILLCVCSTSYASPPPADEGSYTNIMDLPRVNIDDVRYIPSGRFAAQLPWRQGAEKEAAKLEGEQKAVESGLREGVQAITDGQRAILEEIRAMRGEKKAPEAQPEEKQSLKERVKDKADEAKDALLESPFARHAAILAAIVLVLLVGHAIYVKCHADKDKISAGLSALPVGGPVLASMFGKLDDFNTSIDAKVQALKSQAAQAANPVPAPQPPAASPAPPAAK